MLRSNPVRMVVVLTAITVMIGVFLTAPSQETQPSETTLKRLSVGNIFELNKNQLDSNEIRLRVASFLVDRNGLCLWFALESQSNAAINSVLVKTDLAGRLENKVELTNAPIHGFAQDISGSLKVFQSGKLISFSSQNLERQDVVNVTSSGYFGWAGHEPILAVRGKILFPNEPERIIVNSELGGLRPLFHVAGLENGTFGILDGFEREFFAGTTSSKMLRRSRLESSYIDAAQSNYNPTVNASDGSKPRRPLIFADLAAFNERFYAILTGHDYRPGAVVISFDSRGEVDRILRCSVLDSDPDSTSTRFVVAPEFISVNHSTLVLADSEGGFSVCEL